MGGGGRINKIHHAGTLVGMTGLRQFNEDDAKEERGK